MARPASDRELAPLAAVTVFTALVVAIPIWAGAAQARAGSASLAIPNDPGFAGCERQDPIKGSTDNEQWDLFGRLTGNTCLAPGGTVPDRPHPDGGLPCWALKATDPQHAAGVDMTGAWAQGNVGRPDVLMAYIEGGVNYRDDGIKDSLDHIYLNRGELPYPEHANGRSVGRYDANHDGRFDIRDYDRDPRVKPPCPRGVAPFFRHAEGVTWGCVAGGRHAYIDAVDVAGRKTPYLTPEDLIAVFGHCRIVRGIVRACPPGGRFDNDHNGYPNDTSGWNFDRNTNDPQTDEPQHLLGRRDLDLGRPPVHGLGPGDDPVRRAERARPPHHSLAADAERGQAGPDGHREPGDPQRQFPGVPQQWPGNPGSATNATHTNWSTQYGYGPPDVGAATRPASVARRDDLLRDPGDRRGRNISALSNVVGVRVAPPVSLRAAGAGTRSG